MSPTGDVNTLAQIRVRFSDDLIPLQRLESPDETAILAHFSLEPALPGRFRFLTPRMIGFEADRAWPAATRVRVTIAKGLQDLHGHALAEDVAWTFQTPGVSIDGLPGGAYDTTPTTLHPTIEFRSNVPLDRASLEAHARIKRHGDSGDGIALTVPPDTGSPSPSPRRSLRPRRTRRSIRRCAITAMRSSPPPSSQRARSTTSSSGPASCRPTATSPAIRSSPAS